MKIIEIGRSVLALSLLTTLPLQSGDYTYSSSKDVAKNVIAEPSELDVSFIIPGWLAGIEGDIGFLPDVTTGVNAEIGEILPTIDMIAAGTLEVRRNKLGFILDGMYMKLSVAGETPGPFLNNINMTATQALVEGIVTYRIFENDRAWLELLAGGRYQYLENEVSFTRRFRGPQTLTSIQSWVDPFIGIQGQYELADKVYAKVRGDIGGFGVSSDSTYNLFGVVGFELTERTSMELGYRYLYTDYTQGGFLYDMAMKGAFLGLRIDF